MYPQGRMSHHFREMQVGHYLAVKGPKVNALFQMNRFFSFFHNSYQILCCSSTTMLRSGNKEGGVFASKGFFLSFITLILDFHYYHLIVNTCIAIALLLPLCVKRDA
jgi:hypothetical protein